MRAMASSLWSYLKSHPLLTASSVLLLFALPVFHVLMFFGPLIFSTVLGVLAVISFGWTSVEQEAAPCKAAELSALQLDSTAEKISNVLMIGSREVTWLEWLHNEDIQKLCSNELEPALWDDDRCDSTSMAMCNVATSTSMATADASTGKYEALDDAHLETPCEGIPSVWGSACDSQMGLVFTEEDESANAAPPSSVLDGFTPSGPAAVIQDLHKEKVTMETSTVKDSKSPGECGLHEVFPSVNKAISNTSEPKVAHTLMQGAMDTPVLSRKVYPFAETKCTEGRKRQETDKQNEEDQDSSQSCPRWDASDGEEDRSGLHFSFFHNCVHTAFKL